MKRLFLAGEGPTELGEWARHPANRSIPPARGILEALLEHVRADGWEIVGAVRWKDITKARVGGHKSAESRNVLGAALEARERGCDALLFVRDRDRDEGREAAIERGVAEAKDLFRLDAAGCLAVEAIEAWVLAFRGERRSEKHARPKEPLRARHLDDRADGGRHLRGERFRGAGRRGLPPKMARARGRPLGVTGEAHPGAGGRTSLAARERIHEVCSVKSRLVNMGNSRGVRLPKPLYRAGRPRRRGGAPRSGGRDPRQARPGGASGLGRSRRARRGGRGPRHRVGDISAAALREGRRLSAGGPSSSTSRRDPRHS